MTDVKVLIVGAGWAGATVCEMLERNGIKSEIFETTDKVGGHSRSEIINGIIYEPNGPHIFHTSNEMVNKFVNQYGMNRKFKHQVETRIYPESLKGESKLVSWPPQVEELMNFEEWGSIKEELNSLPKLINKENFETYAISIMGATLYSLFIEGYTYKQWGVEGSKLSSEFAPKRIDLRNDGNKNLFNDTYEYFHPNGSGEIIEKILENKLINLNSKINIDNLEELSSHYDHIVITAPLDDFLNKKEKLPWRGIKSEPMYFENENFNTESYQINHPSLNEEFTRTIETKHASGQNINGTVVCKEYSFPDIRHYPILGKDGKSKKYNDELKNEIITLNDSKNKIHFCGRLANYQYINQDQAIEQGMQTAKDIINFYR